LNRID